MDGPRADEPAFDPGDLRAHVRAAAGQLRALLEAGAEWVPEVPADAGRASSVVRRPSSEAPRALPEAPRSTPEAPRSTPEAPQPGDAGRAPSVVRRPSSEAPRPASASWAAFLGHAATQAAAPVADLDTSSMDLAGVAAAVAACTRCDLCRSRTRTVPGEGNADRPAVMFVGEGPGADEDATGRPFVGQAGQLLDRMIGAMKVGGVALRREDCFIANVVKCRPPGNATPTDAQTRACLPYLERQIALVRPRFLVALGATAGNTLTGTAEGVGRLRGQVRTRGDIPLVVTYHPAALLRDERWKRPAWDDLQLVMKNL